MTASSHETTRPDVFWRRWLRWLTAFEEAMETTYDDLQDRRMDRIETDVAKLRAEIAAFSPPPS